MDKEENAGLFIILVAAVGIIIIPYAVGWVVLYIIDMFVDLKWPGPFVIWLIGFVIGILFGSGTRHSG